MDGILLEREEEIKRLQDKLQAVNDDYNNDHKVHNDYADGLLEEVEELKAENKRLNDVITLQNADIIQADKQYHLMASSKQYQAEAEEYFHHNPKVKEVYFYMITEYDMKDAESGDLMLSQDDAICSVINTERSN